MSNKRGTYLSDESTRVLKGDKSLRDKDAIRAKKLEAEPKVLVYGNPLYKQYLGEVYSFLYNGNPVSIRFDGTSQPFPKTIAELIQTKLDAAANANIAKVAGDGEQLN